MMTKNLALLRLLCFCLLCLPCLLVAQNATQQLQFAGLRSVAMQGQINAVKTDAAGNLYLLIDQKDGVRLLKTDSTASNVLAQTSLGAKGDVGVAMAFDPAGNLYVAGTTTSASLVATAGAAIGSRTDGSTNSFVARFDANLNPVFVTFTGGSRIAATAIAANSDSVFVTGVTYATNLPVTTAGIQQAPAAGTSGNGFVERFSVSGATLLYATYLTGAGGDTNPAGIAVDASGNAYIAGSTSASGFPTVAALVPTMLGTPSGFLSKLTPAGDAFSFSTFIPGAGLTSIALDTTANSILLAGSVALGQFPVDTVASPIAASGYQVLVRMALDGSSVVSSTLLVPGTQSFAVPDGAGGAWVEGTLTTPLFAAAPLANEGSVFAEHVTSGNVVDQTARFGGLPNANPTFASVPLVPTSLALDPAANLLVAGALEPTASASLLATESYDVPLRNAPTTAFPSLPRGAAQTAATCNGSLCAGSAAYLAKLNPHASGPALSFAADSLPLLVLRNLGSAAATNLQIAATGGSAVQTNCGSTLAPGSECDLLLTGGSAGTLSATGGGDTQSISFGTYAAPASTVVSFPKELDFGIQAATSSPGQRTITVSNLGATNQTFKSGIDSSSKTASPFTEAASDCTLSPTVGSKVLAPGASCHITLAFAATGDAALQAEWAIGGRDVLLTGFAQSQSLGVSASEIDFGTQFLRGLRLPRYLYLSNSGTSALTHAALSTPAGSPFTLTDGCPATLLAGSVCRVRIDYLSTAASNDSATLTLEGGLSVLLTGQTLPPQGVTGSSVNPNLTLTPTTIAFSNAVPVTGVSTETQTVTVRNTGTTAFDLALALSGDFTDVTSCGATLAGGATCAVVLSLAPSQPGVRQGLLAVTAGAGTGPAFVALSGSGTPILPVNNGTLDFGSVPVGEPSMQFFKVSQPFGALTVTAGGAFTVALIEDIGFGHGQPPASAFAASVTGSCRNCFLAVQFLPTAAGAQVSSLVLSSSGNPYLLTLTGVGTALSGLVVSPGVQDFGAVPVHSVSGSVVFTVTNLDTDGAARTLGGPTVTGDFVLSATPTGAQSCTGTLAYGAACQVAVSFAPAAIGTRTGTITLGAGTTATLTGVGAADPGLAISPLALNFSDAPGPAATQQSVTLTNTGAAALQVGVPAASASFTASSNCATLAPGASCSVPVTFQPGPADVAGSLQIPVSGAQSASYTVALNGNYTASQAGLQVVPGVVDFGSSAVGVQSAPRLLTINNATGKALALAVNLPRQIVLVGAPCTSVAAGGSCTFTVGFLPLDNGASAGSIGVTATLQDGTPGPRTIGYAEGYGTGAGTLALTGGLIVQGSYSFGQVASGSTAMQVFTLTNAGKTALTVRRITSGPPFLATTTCGSTLLTGQSCTASVTYAPTNQVAAGTASPATTTDAGALTIESDALSSPDILNLSGQAGPVAVTSPGTGTVLATYTLSQGSLSFGVNAVGDVSAAQIVTLANTGTVALQVLSLGSTADFTVSSSCGTVAPGGSCTLSVESTPQSAGLHTGSLEIATNGATALDFVSLISSGTPPTLTLAPAALDFGSDLVGSSTQLPVQVTNTGTVAITFLAVTASGDYAVGGSCPAPGGTLPAGASCTLLVRFTPVTTGPRTGTLSLATSASTLPRTVALTGVGIQGKLAITPGSLQFGSLVLGSAANQTLTLTNNGTAPVTGLTLMATGDYSVSLPCPAALAPGATCMAQITFTPGTLGLRTGSVTVASSAPSSPVVIPLTGTGIAAGSFTLTVDGGASSSVSVKSGIPATYHLAITPTGGFSGTVALTCAPVVAAEFASCSLLPSSLTLAGAGQTAVATINTITSVGGNARLERPGTSRLEKLLCLLAPGLLTLWKRRRRLRRHLPVLVSLLFLGATLAVCGCGRQGGDFYARYTPAGTYQYQVTATSTSGVQIMQTVTLNLTVTPR